MSGSRFWRIRIRFGENGEDFTSEAWQRNEVGIWYGAWAAEDLTAALQTADPEQYLSKINKKGGLNWGVSASYLHSARRFADIAQEDWVVLYFDGTLCLAQVSSKMRSKIDHPLNRAGEVFKYRQIDRKKTFSLNHLPDGFRLLASAGRGNVHQFRTGYELVQLLGEASSEKDVTKMLHSKPRVEAIDLLGPTAWESVCHAYLAIEHQFVPTGLQIGKTLADVDIVGRCLRDGARIVAQCKKDPNPTAIPDSFLKATADLDEKGMAFYFAYGDCIGERPPPVKVIDRETFLKWSKTERGEQYFNWLFGA